MDTYEYLKASNGSGNSALAHITSTRSIGSTVLEVDTVANWPSEFIATTGTLNPQGNIDPATVTEFRGHIESGDVVIDSFEPGHTDTGNTTDQIVVIKPTTGWANETHKNIGELKSGEGLEDDSIVNRHITNGAVTADKLALGAQTASESSSGTTTSSSFTATLGGSPGTNPSVAVNVTTGTVMVIITAQTFSSINGAGVAVGVDISGANTEAADLVTSLRHTGSGDVRPMTMSKVRYITGLSNGSTTFTLQYRQVGGGTATISSRELTVIPLG